MHRNDFLRMMGNVKAMNILLMCADIEIIKERHVVFPCSAFPYLTNVWFGDKASLWEDMIY
jgi:hypothetical protein